MLRKAARIFPAKAVLPEEVLDELKSLIESYDRLKSGSTGNHAGADAEIDVLRERLKKPATVRWSDLAQAELCKVDVLGDAEVRAHLASWRRRLHEVIGETRYASYLTTSADPNAPTTTSSTLRAELSECISTVSYFYSGFGVAARSRNSVTVSLLWFAALILVVQGVLGVLVSGAPRVHLALPVAAIEYLLATSAAAVVGSVVSVQRRLQDPHVDVDPFYRFIQTNADPLGIAFISVLLGAIFGLGVYGLLASGLIAGTAFPKIEPATGVPEGAQQVALLLVYGFLAGFAEQLVPDALTRIADRTLSGIIGPAPGSPKNAQPNRGATPT